jgi:predicted RNase H-like nuclease (RuvC/YqgF family)
MSVCLESRVPSIDEMESCECRKLGQENADLRFEVERLKGLLSIKRVMMSNLKKELRYIKRSSQLEFTSESGPSSKVELSVLKVRIVQEKEVLEEAHG